MQKRAISVTREMTPQDRATLLAAYQKLEHPSLVVRLSSAAGMPVEAVARELGKRVPESVVRIVSKSTSKALEMVMQSSARTIHGSERKPASPKFHTAAAMATGAVSGFFGLTTLIVELPVTTAIMFRSIMDIARAEGESPDDPETIMNCMQIFAMGSSMSNKDDAAETSYYGVRLALSKAVTDALQFVVANGIGGASAPALIRLTSALAHRFGIVVTQKAMAQAMPVIGAVGGGLVNTVFISHFQDMARGHFSIRALERIYGVQTVQTAYRQLKVPASDIA